ncbi:MAG TPA: hypothetical protein VG755_34950 [Nannocystaceae bacterium]|nr:hypothetical protein [Nannocystaceae bacterium]
MPSVLSVCLAIAVAVAPVRGSDAPKPTPGKKSPASKPNGNGKTEGPPAPFAHAAIREADEAWRRGDYAEVRRWLEPLANDPELKLEPQDRQTMLVLLADSTLSDSSLDAADRRDKARSYLERILDEDASWRMPRDIYSPELYDLYVEVRVDRAGRAGQKCEAGLIVCKSEKATAEDTISSEKAKVAAIQRKYDAQEVEVQQVVQRSRILAAIPGGFGHFYMGNNALGGTFLAAELIFGAAGLGLLIRRNVVDGCRRTRGFQSGSLVCDIRGENDAEVIEARRDQIARRRKAEEAMAWFLLGTVALDIVIAQILFKPTRVKTVERKPRKQLEAERRAGANDSKGRTTPRAGRPRARLRAAPSVSPYGVGLGFDVRF